MKRGPRYALVAITRTETVCHVAHFSERVTWRAAELGITQAAVAKRMGFTPARLANILAKSSITEAMFDRLTKALEWKRSDWRTVFERPESRSQEIVAELAARGKKRTATKKTG